MRLFIWHSQWELLGKSPVRIESVHSQCRRYSGRPSSSHYFVGTQGNFLFYLDPHYTRPALPYFTDPSQYTHDHVGSCHTSRLRKIHIREVDPSMLIAFLIQTEEDWLDWRRCVKHIQGKAVIHVADCNPATRPLASQREAAIDEVEPLSDGSEDMTCEM